MTAIKNRFTGHTIFESESTDIAGIVLEAIKKSVNLSGAYLEGADLEGADLRGAYLREANLREANLEGADLEGTNLEGTYLRGAYLREADLRGAYLEGADLRGAYLEGANLRGAYLEGANLREANLRGANLRGADLVGANLREANLKGANLREANLRGANLVGANLEGAKMDAAQCDRLTIVPDGDLVGWKKCRSGVIVKLKIPGGAKRSNSTGRKCRAEFAEVIEIFGLKDGVKSAVSMHDERFVYEAGATVRCDHWNEDRWTECGGGIHFFITRSEAEAYT